MKAHHKGSPSVKNKSLAAKTAKARKMDCVKSAQSRCDISAQELRFGDWSVPVNGIEMMYHKTTGKISEEERNTTLSITERMRLNRRKAILMAYSA